jgi:hypothetical protein
MQKDNRSDVMKQRSDISQMLQPHCQWAHCDIYTYIDLCTDSEFADTVCGQCPPWAGQATCILIYIYI